MYKKDLGKNKRLGSFLNVSLIIVFVSLVSLFIFSPSFADVSDDGNFTIEPLVTGHDDVIGKTNRDWKFTVHTTAELVLGDVIKFIFPSGLETTDFDLSSATQSAISGLALYDIAEGSTTYGSNILTDGGMEAWLMQPDNWEVANWTASIPNLFQRSEDSNTGTYALSMSTNSSGNYDLLVQGVDITASDTLQATFWAKKSTTGGLAVGYLSSDMGRIYNFNTDSWEDFTGEITSNHLYVPTLTDSYQQFSAEQASMSGETEVADAALFIAPYGGANYTAIIDDIGILVSGVVDSATNGDFDDWTASDNYLTDWLNSYWTDGEDTEAISGIEVNSSNIQAGTYATSLGSNHSVDNNDAYIGQNFSGVVGDNYRISFYARSVDIGGTVTSSFSFFNGDPSTATQYYNFSTNQWDSYTIVSTIPDSDHRQDDSLTTNFQQFTFDNAGLVVPASGIITPVISALVSTEWEGAAAVAMIVDTVSMEKVTTTTPTAGVAYNASAPTVVYGMATETIASGTDFYITIGGITNGTGPTQSSVNSLTWQVIAGTPSNSAEPYGALSSTKFSFTANDNLLKPAFTADAPPAPVATEDGSTGSYSFYLKTQPTANVTVTVTPTAQITVSPATLVFTSANWATPQAVTVTAVDDDIDEESEHNGLITHSVASDDTDYDGATIANVTVTITDNDTAGVTNSETAIAVTEGSTTDTYTIVIDTEPTANVLITPSATGSELTFSASTLTFTSENWSTPQTLTITAVDDSDVEGAHADTITHTAVSDDTNYNGITIANVTATITDNDDASRRNTSGSSSNNNSSITAQLPLAPTTSAEPTLQTTITTNTPTHVYVGNTSHTVTVGTPNTNGSVLITVQSDPITTTMLVGEEKLLDTDGDEENDLFLRLDEVIGNTVKLTISAIEDLEFSINRALSTTNSQDVTLYFNSQYASTMAISNSASFDDSSFENYTTTKTWHLTDGAGLKTIYVKLRTSNGGTKTISDSITLIESETEDISEPEIVINCALTTGSAYKLANSPAVYYITNNCNKRPFKNPEIFFTYFDSWNDVQTTTAVLLNSVENDSIDFMPWGPSYDPKYGALVKIVADPKVYLLLGTEKYWITSETVFNSLNYSWNWIEDIDESLLAKYTIGSEITGLEHHPNYTLIKYPTNTKVYRLEPNPTDSSKQVKRWIVNEGTFNSLNFRWDRIVTITGDEVYENGLNLY